MMIKILLNSAHMPVPPDETAPTVTSASVDSLGTTLTVNFSEVMVNNTGMSINATVTTTAALSAPVNNGSQITWTISPTIVVADAVTIDYTQGEIQDNSGNLLANFAGQAVTNNAIDPNNPYAPELPREYIDTTYSLPTGGTTITVGSDPGDDYDTTQLQAAIDAAVLGDVLVLRAGDTFTGHFELPDKGVGTDWIYIISSSLASLPEGTRVDAADATHMPKIVNSGTSLPAIWTNFSAHHYRIAGVEFSTGDVLNDLVRTGFGVDDGQSVFDIHKAETVEELPHNITFDRCYIHSTSEANKLRHGIMLNGITMAVIDSNIANIKDTSDAQAIFVTNGDGPYKVVNNYLEATGENVMFGGEDPKVPNSVPSDIELRGNYMFKPLKWKASDPSYGGYDWGVKNLLEFKNAQRIWATGNTLENNWVDSQAGVGVLFTVRNQFGNAPWSVVQDVMFENNHLKNSYGGFNIIGDDDLQTSQNTKRITIRNNKVEGIERDLFEATSNLEPIRYLKIVNNLLLHDLTKVGNGVLTMSGDKVKIAEFTFEDNVVTYGNYGMTNMTNYTNVYSTTNSGYVLNDASGRFEYNRDNFSWLQPDDIKVDDIDDVLFVDYPNDDYNLSQPSPFKSTATDGGDPGPDWTEFDAAIAGSVTGVWS